MSSSVPSPLTVASAHDHIRQALRGAFDAQCAELFRQWDSGTRVHKMTARAHISRLRNRVLDNLLAVDARAELRHAINVQYTEVRCRWTLLNARIQTQTARDGRADDRLTYLATGVSFIVQALEPLLTQEHIDATATLLSPPDDD